MSEDEVNQSGADKFCAFLNDIDANATEEILHKGPGTLSDWAGNAFLSRIFIKQEQWNEGICVCISSDFDRNDTLLLITSGDKVHTVKTYYPDRFDLAYKFWVELPSEQIPDVF